MHTMHTMHTMLTMLSVQFGGSSEPAVGRRPENEGIGRNGRSNL